MIALLKVTDRKTSMRSNLLTHGVSGKAKNNWTCGTCWRLAELDDDSKVIKLLQQLTKAINVFLVALTKFFKA